MSLKVCGVAQELVGSSQGRTSEGQSIDMHGVQRDTPAQWGVAEAAYQVQETRKAAQALQHILGSDMLCREP